jgi:cytochrome c oxidase subunit 2
MRFKPEGEGRMRAGVMFAILMVAGIGLGSLSAAADQNEAAPGNERVIHIVARRYRFEPNRINLKAGVPVTLEVISPEVLMSLNAPDFMISEALPPGQPVRIHFTPSQGGEFIFVCDIYCGSGHEKMRGLIAVSQP